MILKIAIINASPLIYLGKIGALQCLPKLFPKCITTRLVKDEVLAQKRAPEYVILHNSFSDWLEIENPSNTKLVKKLEELRIHPGEASVIALAKGLHEREQKNIVLIDDLTAREIARTLDLAVTGTLGVILKALRSGIINGKIARQFLDAIVEKTTFHLSAELYLKIPREIENME
ncbi:MAG: DUF3368 domain-containing protein [Promethearchaeia archaeon]